MVKLTPYEQEMLDGKHGAFKQLAMKKTVEYAEALGAEELCEVTIGHISLGAPELYFYEPKPGESYEKSFAKVYFNQDEPVEIGEFDRNCNIQTDGGITSYYDYEYEGLPKELYEKNWALMQRTCEKGACIGGSCTPYLAGMVPLKGEHFVTTESSAVLMYNAVFGACGNAAGSTMCLWAAVCGRAPKWGNHIEANKRGNQAFSVEFPLRDSFDWDILGYLVGKKMKTGAVPVVMAKFETRPTIDFLKQMFAAMATTSSAEMCHIVGVTPDAPTLEAAMGGNEIGEIVKITQEEYDEAVAWLNMKPCGPVQLVALGCPHYSLKEFQRLAEYLQGKKVKEGVRLIVWTSPAIREMARLNGFEDVLREAGGIIGTNGCLLLHNSAATYPGVSGIAVDSAKQAHYLRSQTKADLYYGRMEDCVDAAVSGEWRCAK